jgi:hypothetical protein
MGCSSCQVPYSNEGFYEGDDSTIPGEKPGHLLVHSIQGTRQAKVTVHDQTCSGIPVETCTMCTTGASGSAFHFAIDMSPTQPHTTTRNARSCESCHASQKALGLGIGSTRPSDEQHFEESRKNNRDLVAFIALRTFIN